MRYSQRLELRIAQRPRVRKELAKDSHGTGSNEGCSSRELGAEASPCLSPPAGFVEPIVPQLLRLHQYARVNEIILERFAKVTMVEQKTDRGQEENLDGFR